MENTNARTDSDNNGAGENPNNNNNGMDDDNNPLNGNDAGNRPRRTPFTGLSQVDADLALARTLQEQERAYMMLRMESGGSSDYGSWEAESYRHDDDVDEDDYDDATGEDYDSDRSDVEADNDEGDPFDEHAHAEGEENDGQNVELDPSTFSSDEAYARALQDAEERDMAARLLALAGINEMIVGEDEDEQEHGGNSQITTSLYFCHFDNKSFVEYHSDSRRYFFRQLLTSSPLLPSGCPCCHQPLPLLVQLHQSFRDLQHYDNHVLPMDAWEELDPDELSYEELLALGEFVGTESRGLSAETIASLPSINFKSQGNQEGSCDSCVICRLDYEDGDALTVLSCKHSYHSECINNWLQINKVCPVCSAEVSTSGIS